MDTYSLLREFADSWFLLGMTLFFLGACLFAFRPGSRAIHEDAARAVFRGEAPADAPAPSPAAGCGRGCPGCACGAALAPEPRR